jgi:hypothetical protein
VNSTRCEPVELSSRPIGPEWNGARSAPWFEAATVGICDCELITAPQAGHDRDRSLSSAPQRGQMPKTR